jgi:type VI secretion system secreted protein Hcp
MGVSLFLTVDGVTGASRAEHHGGSIECSSWSWGLTSDGHHFGGGQGAGKARLDEVVVSMPTTAALPQLLGLCASGRHASHAVLAATNGGDVDHTWLRVTLSDVAVSRVVTAASAAQQRSDDEAHLAFATITVEHIAHGPDGQPQPATVFAWDARRQRAITTADGADASDNVGPSVSDAGGPDQGGKKGRKGKRNQPKVKAKGMARLLD